MLLFCGQTNSTIVVSRVQVLQLILQKFVLLLLFLSFGILFQQIVQINQMQAENELNKLK